ncbi:uncharacterized protein LOC111946340 [Oryzias latipes]
MADGCKIGAKGESLARDVRSVRHPSRNLTAERRCVWKSETRGVFQEAGYASSHVVCSPSTVQLGRDVVLSCRGEPQSDLTAETLEWKCGTAFVHVYRSGGDNFDDQDLRFKNRTILNHQNLKDGNVSLTLTKVTKEDEGNYTFCLLKQKPLKCSNVTLTVVPQMNNETHNQTGSAQSSDVIAAIGVLGGVLLLGVGGILGFRYCRRNRDRTDPQPDSASIALRIMEEGESSQPPLDEGGADPEQFSSPFIDDHLNQSHDGDVPDHYSEGGAEAAAAGNRNFNCDGATDL